MSFARRPWLLLAVLSSVLFLTSLGSATLFDEDEPKNAVCGVEMFGRGDWIVPTFNEDLRTDKPILIYWLMQLSFHAFGISEFSARFHSAILSIGSTLLVYRLGARLFSTGAGFWAGLVFCTSINVHVVGRAVTPDATLIFCLLTACWLFVEAIPHWTLTSQHNFWRGYLPAHWWQMGLVFAALGLAILAKGPVGIVLPTAIVGVFLLTLRQLGDASSYEDLSAWYRRWPRQIRLALMPARLLEVGLALRPLLGLLIVAAIALPWYIAVGVQTNGAWLVGFLGGHNIDRFLSPMENHSGPIVYYVPVICAGFFPWSVFLGIVLFDVVRQVQRDAVNRPALLFVLIWLTVWIGFFSFAKTKLPNYVLPAYPALALLTGRYLYHWQQAIGRVDLRWYLIGTRILSIAGLATMVGILIASQQLFEGYSAVALVGVIPLLAGGIAYYFAKEGKRFSSVMSLSAGACALLLTLSTFVVPAFSRLQDAPWVAAVARKHSAIGGGTVGAFDYSSPALKYYVGTKIVGVTSDEQLAEFCAKENHFLVTKKATAERLAPVLPSGVRVLANRQRFLRNHDIVVLGRTNEIAERAGNATSFR